MSDHDDLLSARDVDADGERFVDPLDDDIALPDELTATSEGSIADIVDQHLVVPEDDDV